MNKQKSVSFLTVVHAGDLPLLELQARSLAEYANFSELDEIFVVVNDKKEAETARQVRDLAARYGALESRLRVLTASEVFAGASIAKTFGQKLRYALCAHPALSVTRLWSGWKGNWGWATQQALKLSAPRFMASEYCVILDAKNVAVEKLELSDFVSPTGTPFAQIQEQSKLHFRWLPASRRLLGLKRDRSELVTQFITPFVSRVSFVNEAREAVEGRHGPVEALFSIRAMNAALWPIFNYTEFMILNAYAQKTEPEGVCGVFENQPAIVHGVHAASSPSEVSVWLDTLGTRKMLALHASTIGALPQHQQNRLGAFLVERGILRSVEELCACVERLADLNAKAISSANSRREKD